MKRYTSDDTEGDTGNESLPEPLPATESDPFTDVGECVLVNLSGYYPQPIEGCLRAFGELAGRLHARRAAKGLNDSKGLSRFGRGPIGDTLSLNFETASDYAPFPIKDCLKEISKFFKLQPL